MISVGLIGTSWYSDLMFLSSLQDHPQGRITAICGRNRERAQEVADKWKIPQVYTDYEAMIDRGEIQALIVATPNNSHYPMTMKGLDAGLHIICEKPLALNYGEAKQMADLATQKGVKNFVPFTWRFTPPACYIKELIDDGYIGKPYHLNLRWQSNFGRNSDYQWRYDKRLAGTGILGDLGSHFIYLASWYFGKISSVSCQLGFLRERAPLDPDGQPYELADDVALLLLQFENGALGSLHLSAVADDPTSPQWMEFHGSDGTLYSAIDFGRLQRVTGKRAGDEAIAELSIPDRIWQGANRESVLATFNDLQHKQDFMTRGFITAIVEGRPVKPDFQDGASVQRVLDAALKSHQERSWVDVDSIN
jgi:predicted dehydrogenase